MSVPLTERCLLELADGPGTATEIGNATNEPIGQISTALCRLTVRGLAVRLWQVRRRRGRPAWVYALPHYAHRVRGSRERAPTPQHLGKKAGPLFYPGLTGWGKW